MNPNNDKKIKTLRESFNTAREESLIYASYMELTPLQLASNEEGPVWPSEDEALALMAKANSKATSLRTLGPWKCNQPAKTLNTRFKFLT